MTELLSIISTIEGKASRLMRHADALKHQLKYQENRNMELVAEMVEKDKKIGQLEEQIKLMQTAGALNQNGTGSQDAKLKINELVREIDKCIALLNR